MRGLKLVSAALFLLLLATAVHAAEPDRIVSNSADWRDVYSILLFGSLTGRSSTFLVSDRHASVLGNTLPAGGHIWVINSPTVPFTRAYGSYLEGQGFTTESFTYDNTNLELARQVDTTSFIIVDDSYGYNAVSVAPYASVSNSYVLFADSSNIGEIADFLAEKGATSVLIYGHVDREVLAALTQYNPVIINHDGDRFANNIEIVKLYQALSPARQVILTNGEFIEQEIMSGKEPVIFIGRNNVPEVVRTYVQGSDISVGVLIGNELVNTATFIRRQVGISVFVKFARSARGAASAISQVEALDMFYLPTYRLNLEIDDLSYNRATRQLEVVMRNTEKQAAYFIGSYTIRHGDGSRETVGDAEAVFIEPNSFKTVTYVVNEIDENTVIDAYAIYGESRNALEFVIDEQYCLSCTKKFSTVDIIDECSVNMTGLSYNLGRQLFYAGITNTGTAGCYLDIELADVIVAAERVTYHLDDVAFLDAGENRQFRIKGQLEEEDLGDNPRVLARVYHGQRQNALVKLFEARFPLVITTAAFSTATLLSYGALAVIILLASLLAWRSIKGRKRGK